MGRIAHCSHYPPVADLKKELAHRLHSLKLNLPVGNREPTQFHLCPSVGFPRLFLYSNWTVIYSTLFGAVDQSDVFNAMLSMICFIILVPHFHRNLQNGY